MHHDFISKVVKDNMMEVTYDGKVWEYMKLIKASIVDRAEYFKAKTLVQIESDFFVE